MINDTSNTLVAATALEMEEAVVEVIRGGCGGKSCCKKATNAVRAIGKKRDENRGFDKSVRNGRTDGQSLLMRCEDASKKKPWIFTSRRTKPGRLMMRPHSI